MAKKKKVIEKPIVEEVIEEVIENEVEEEVIEETTENISVVEEVAIEEPPKKDNSDDAREQFINLQLKLINKISNPAKAKRLAERVQRNRKR